jgi:hypothetical protein
MAIKLYSYVVDHDYGHSPHASDELCTLVHCKFNVSGKRRSIVELANIGDWVLGTGGQSKESAGNGKIVYLMRVDEITSFSDYLTNPRFFGRIDRYDDGQNNTRALISKNFYYFGENAIDIPEPFRHLKIEKIGSGYRQDLNEENVLALIAWFKQNQTIGKRGNPIYPVERTPSPPNESKTSICNSKCGQQEPMATTCKIYNIC